VTSQIHVQFTSFVYNMPGSNVTRLCSPKDNWYVICDKKNPPWFVIWYDFYPTRCVFSIPEPRLGDRKHKTRWIKIISNHKPWEILYLTLYRYIMKYFISELFKMETGNGDSREIAEIKMLVRIKTYKRTKIHVLVYQTHSFNWYFYII
jgi:hypothetical protein